MKQLYNKDIYDVNKPVKSYWEKVSQIEQDKYPKLTTHETCDVCVIGGGFTGISTAYHIAKNYGGDVDYLRLDILDLQAVQEMLASVVCLQQNYQLTN